MNSGEQSNEPSPSAGISMAALDTLDPDAFDWTAYSGTYKGRALITRLTFISNLIVHASQSPTPRTLALARAAALQAIPLLKETLDTDLYLRIVGLIDATLHPDKLPHPAAAGGTGNADEPMDIDSVYARKGAEKDGRPDAVWIEERRATQQAEENRLGVELNGYISNLYKESIRLTYLDMAKLDLKAGSLPKAVTAFHHAREYSSGPAHHVELGLLVIEAGLSFNDPTPLGGYISKVEAMLDRLHPPTSTIAGPTTSTMTQLQVQQNRDAAAHNQAVRRDVGVKLRVARAVAALAQKDYQRAARELGEISEEGGLQDWEGEVISTSDVALICAICTLATGSRDHTRRVLLDRASFHAAVGDSQGWIFDLVRAFVDARYGEALGILRKAEPYMILNPLLSPHAAQLISMIRTRGIVQYLSPFSSVRIPAMADAFGADEDAMLAELCDLAERAEIRVKVDLVDRVLTIKEEDKRADAFRSALEGGSAISATVQANTFRMRLKEAGVVIDPAPREDRDGKKGGGGGGGGGSGGGRDRDRDHEREGNGGGPAWSTKLRKATVS